MRFKGWTDHANVPALMRRHEVFLFPSKYEGFPMALIEAMAGGCAPVASRLQGITDHIVEDGLSGLLFRIGDARQAAEHTLVLLSDPARLLSLRRCAQNSTARYSLISQAQHYLRLFSKIQSSPLVPSVEDLQCWTLASGLRPAWWHGMPAPAKSYLRLVREKVQPWITVP